MFLLLAGPLSHRHLHSFSSPIGIHLLHEWFLHDGPHVIVDRKDPLVRQETALDRGGMVHPVFDRLGRMRIGLGVDIMFVVVVVVIARTAATHTGSGNGG